MSSTLNADRFLAPPVQGGFGNAFGTRIPWKVDTSDRLESALEQVAARCTRGCATGNCCCGSGSGKITEDVVLDAAFAGGLRGAPKSRDLGDSLLGDYLAQGGDPVPTTLFSQSAGGLTEIDSIAGLFALAETDQTFRERRDLSEIDPAGAGRQVQGLFLNRVVGNVQVPVSVNEFDQFFGSVSTGLSSRRMDTLNGFGFGVPNDFSYAPEGRPGSARRGFIRDFFYITIGDGENSPWARRIFQRRRIRRETQGLALYVNGMVGRTLFLLRRPEPYYFIFAPPRSNPETYPYDPCCFDVCSNGFYFTTDQIGGNASNSINDGEQPPVFPLSRMIKPNNNVYSVVVNNEWPDHLYYQSLHAPFGGGDVLVFGKYP